MDESWVQQAAWALSSAPHVDELSSQLLRTVLTTGAQSAALRLRSGAHFSGGVPTPEYMDAALQQTLEEGQPVARASSEGHLLCLPVAWRGVCHGALAAWLAPGTPNGELLHYLATQTAICLAALGERQRLQAALTAAQSVGDGGDFAARMASGFAHLIRNSLTSTNFCLEAIGLAVEENTVDAADMREALDAGRRGVERALRAAGRLSELAQIQSTGHRAPVIAAGLGRVAQTVIFRMSSQLQEQRVDVHIDIPDAISVAIHESHLQSLLTHIITNSCDALAEHPPPGGGRLAVTCSSAAAQVAVSISDNGPGLTQEARTRLFEPFFTTRGSAGTGLGLVICQRIVGAYHGSISVQNLPVGAAVILHLPHAP